MTTENSDRNHLTELEYVALQYRFALELASELSGKSMTELGKIVNGTVMNMPPNERKKIAIESSNDIHQLHQVFHLCCEHE